MFQNSLIAKAEAELYKESLITLNRSLDPQMSQTEIETRTAEFERQELERRDNWTRDNVGLD